MITLVPVIFRVKIFSNDYNLVKTNYIICFSFFIIMFLFSFSKPVLIDTDAYRYTELYNNIRINGFIPTYLEVTEFGYLKLNQAFSYANVDHKVFFSLISSFQLLIYVFFIKKLKLEIKLTSWFFFFLFTLGYYNWSLNGIRQALAIVIFTYSIRYIINKSFIKYLACLVFASLFHKTVIIMLPLYFIRNLRFSQFGLIIIYTISVLSIFIFSGSTNALQNIISVLNIDDLNVYLNSDILNVDDERTSSGLGVVIRVLFGFIIINNSIAIINYTKSNIFFNLYFISQVLLNVFYGVEAISRFTTYFTPINAFILASFVCVSSTRIQKLCALIIVIVQSIIYLKLSAAHINNFL